jgi:hypothetical protein
MNTTEMLDNFITKEGDGNVRDALNVALARLDAKTSENDNLRAFVFGSAWELNEKLKASIGETLNTVGEIAKLRHANRVLIGACDMWADKYEALQTSLCAENSHLLNPLDGKQVVIEQRSKIIKDILDFDIEDYIQSLPWTDDAKDYEKTITAGNLRRLFFKLTHADSTIIE